MRGRRPVPLRRRRESEIWERLNRIVWALIILAVIALVVSFFYPAVSELSGYRDRVDSKREALEEARKTNAERSEELHLLQTDPEYVETIARDRLDLMKEGETIFRLDGSRSPTP